MKYWGIIIIVYLKGTSVAHPIEASQDKPELIRLDQMPWNILGNNSP